MDLNQIANAVVILLAFVAVYGFYLTTRTILLLADKWKELKVMDRIGLLFITLIGFGTTYSAVRLADEVMSIFA